MLICVQINFEINNVIIIYLSRGGSEGWPEVAMATPNLELATANGMGWFVIISPPKS